MLGQPTSFFKTGQAKIATGGTAVQLTAAQTPVQNGITIKADKNNTSPLQVANISTVSTTNDGTGNSFTLYPGDSISMSITDVSMVWLNGLHAGDFLTWLAN